VLIKEFSACRRFTKEKAATEFKTFGPADDVEIAMSKTSQFEPVRIPLPEREMPSLRPRLERWIAMAKIEPGGPIFRAINGRHIRNRRIAGDTVLDIVRRRVLAYARATGMSKADALALANAYRGHSMRRGYCTTATRKRIPLNQIRARSRHASNEILGGYIEEAESWLKSGLKGVGF
jgi:hypothetical protein